MMDSYIEFMKEFSISEEEFIDFGIKNTIYAQIDEPRKKQEFENHWNSLKKSIEVPNEVDPQLVYIRGYGRDAAGTELYLSMYKDIFMHSNFLKDATNNDIPTRKIKILTGKAKGVKTESKYEKIQNYQVSHVFERTKNPYAFTAPWNIVYIPKIVDPFTGHESKGSLTRNFTRKFQEHVYNTFKEYIDEFNEIVSDLQPKLQEYLQGIENEQFKIDVLKQFKIIELGDEHEILTKD
jgi:hypothetical protein